MPSTPPGLEIYSKEWYEAYATKVEEPFMPAVKAICEGYYMGNTGDPNLIGSMIADGIRSMIGKIFVFKKDALGRTRKDVCTGVLIKSDGVYVRGSNATLYNVERILRDITQEASNGVK